MKLDVIDQQNGQVIKTIDVIDRAFGQDFNSDLVHQAVTTYLSNARAGTKAQKNRSNVRGGGIKPWTQKGTGRARAGTIRSPLWRGGGVTFAASPRSFNKKLNKKMRCSAIRSVFSELIRQERLIIIDRLELPDHKTKGLVAQLKKLDLDNVLIVLDQDDQNIFRAANNIPNVSVMFVNQLNPVSLIASEKVLITEQSLKKIEEKLS